MKFINSQKDSVDVRLKNSEKEIQLFKKENNVKSSDVMRDKDLSSLNEIENSIIRIK